MTAAAFFCLVALILIAPHTSAQGAMSCAILALAAALMAFGFEVSR